jgi:acetyl esterase/lipase
LIIETVEHLLSPCNPFNCRKKILSFHPKKEKMRSIKSLMAILLITLVAACSKNSPTEEAPLPVTKLNVAYGTDPKQNMDVYLPAVRSTANTKVVVMIHGGSWTGGDKTDVEFARFIDTIKRRLPDYAIFNINYRLSANPNNVFPTQENDVKLALESIFSKSAEYSISNKYILIGASAGAHLAMLQAYKYSTPVKPKVVVSFFGPSDLTDMYNNPVGNNPLLSFGLSQAIGKTPAQDPAIYTNSSPVTFISLATAVPTILLHGGADPLVKPSQSTAVRDRLMIAGVPTQYVPYATGGHGDWSNAMYSDAFINIENFIRTHVN